MKADYFRYLAEFSEGASKAEHAASAETAYTAATNAAAGLAPTHPIRLGLALNYSVFMYELPLTTLTKGAVGREGASARCACLLRALSSDLLLSSPRALPLSNTPPTHANPDPTPTPTAVFYQ